MFRLSGHQSTDGQNVNMDDKERHLAGDMSSYIKDTCNMRRYITQMPIKLPVMHE